MFINIFYGFFFSCDVVFGTFFFVIIFLRPVDPFDELLHHYRGLLFSLCGRFRHRGLDREDLVQEAVIALWRDRERLLVLGGVQQAALTWRIARNTVIDALRRTEQTEDLPEWHDSPAEDRSLVEHLHERIALLPEPDRTIVQMQLAGYSYEEIGQQLGMTEKNVSVRLVRIKEKIRKEWT